ncbi:MAG: DUF4926 domain-containing protein [Anaerolineae bacterium]|nr:DUF4926 domain-containing protein [Anaerolineae bacterium]
MRPFDTVVLNEDMPEYGIVAGTEGAIVEDLANGEAFIVEFFDSDGHTIDVVTVYPNQITVVTPDFFDGEKVALTQDLREYQLLRGQVGTIEKRLGDGNYTVAFADQSGVIYAKANIHGTKLMLLHWQQIPSHHSA